MSFAAASLAEAPATQPRGRVLIVSIDGLRPDLMLRARTPVLTGLMESGSFTCWAQTTAASVTIPSHISMVTGVRPQKHKIEWNYDLPLAKPVYPAVPTLFELAHEAGYSTAMIAGKTKFSLLAKPGTLDYVYVPTDNDVTDSVVLEQALVILSSQSPDLLYVHLPSVDQAGHAKGWGTNEQLLAIARADAALGRILDELETRKLLEQTLVIVSSDHGGAGRTHGPDDVRSRNIPWIAAGPGVRRNYDLTRYPDLTVKTEDTFATAAAYLGLKAPANVDGRAVEEIYERRDVELLTATR